MDFYYDGLLFSEDDAKPEGYTTINQWWNERFGRDFREDWKTAEKMDFGDSDTAFIEVEGQIFNVTIAFDGAYVHEGTPERIERTKEAYKSHLEWEKAYKERENAKLNP